MSDEKLSKSTLDELLRLTQVFYDHPGSEEAESAILDRIQLSKTMPDVLNCGLSWLAFLELVDAVVRLAQGDKSEALYKVLDVLGWSVVSDEQAEH